MISAFASPAAEPSALIISVWRPVPASMFSVPSRLSSVPLMKLGWSFRPTLAPEET